MGNSSDETGTLLVQNQPYDNFAAGTFILLVSCPSLLANFSVAYFLLRLKTMRSQFAYLCVSLAVADCGVLLCFTFWSAPMTYIQDYDLSTGTVGKKIGQLSLLFWFAGLYATLTIAVNRFIALAHPLKYKYWFSTRNTVILIVSGWALGVVHWLVYFVPECDFYYDPTTYVWTYADTECGHWVSWTLDLGFGVVFFVLIFSFNIATGCMIRRANKTIQPATAASAQPQNGAARRHKREVRFFVQTCINGAVFEIMLLCFHIVSRFATEKWGLFVATTMIWQISHGTNGFVFLLFNPELRKGMAYVVCCLRDNMENGLNRRGTVHHLMTTPRDQIQFHAGQATPIHVPVEEPYQYRRRDTININ